jgi:predicted alpha/beta hydrolase family esterase
VLGPSPSCDDMTRLAPTSSPSARRLLFIQGGGEGAHDYDAPLAASLRDVLGVGWTVDYPIIDDEGDPSVASWGPQLDRLLNELDPRSFLVAHSVGATILLNQLSARHERPNAAGLFLIAAPFVGERGWPSEEIPPMTDLGSRLPRGLPVFVYHGALDDVVPAAHADLYATAIPGAVVRRIDGANHQLNGDLSVVAADIQSVLAGR